MLESDLQGQQRPHFSRVPVSYFERALTRQHFLLRTRTLQDVEDEQSVHNDLLHFAVVPSYRQSGATSGNSDIRKHGAVRTRSTEPDHTTSIRRGQFVVWLPLSCVHHVGLGRLLTA